MKYYCTYITIINKVIQSSNQIKYLGIIVMFKDTKDKRTKKIKKK
jgi:hypothetical protein